MKKNYFCCEKMFKKNKIKKEILKLIKKNQLEIDAFQINNKFIKENI